MGILCKTVMQVAYILTSLLIIAFHGDVIHGLQGRAGRVLNPLIQVITFPNDPCTGSSTSLLGTCFTPPECNAKTGALADGNCASGFGVCCVILVDGCGGALLSNNTHLENPSFPDKYKEATTCTYNLDKVDPDVCFIRLEFVNFILDGPDSRVSPNWDCHNDKVVFTTTGTTFERTWQIRVDQIYCGTLFSPPHGCLQYFQGATGRFRTFNYGLNDDYHHLNNADYA